MNGVIYYFDPRLKLLRDQSIFKCFVGSLAQDPVVLQPGGPSFGFATYVGICIRGLFRKLSQRRLNNFNLLIVHYFGRLTFQSVDTSALGCVDDWVMSWVKLEARTGFEPVKNGVADRCITTLPPSHKKTSEAFAYRGF